MENSGAQTLYKGLTLIDAVAGGNRSLKQICATVNLPRSTAHRLLTMLVQQKYLRQIANEYFLGPRLIEYGMRSLSEYPLRSAASPYLQELAQLTHDTVHLGIREEMEVFYIDKIAGSRAIEMNSRVGYRMPLDITGVGKSLLLDCSDNELTDISHYFNRSAERLTIFLELMHKYRALGYTLDLSENEANIRCVAAPVRDASGIIIAAVSVASLDIYMDDERMLSLTSVVKNTAMNISMELGWCARKIS
ncbi:IclR family transcriptional regulator [Acerihabitans sp. KWT182]|uniref:HTH-type transcriptional repressor AllR n=1 Tax=Acerihabitans sp. KWT182 TaxID=3157919 RepID=A0AAU7QCK2_9GAMM